MRKLELESSKSIEDSPIANSDGCYWTSSPVTPYKFRMIYVEGGIELPGEARRRREGSGDYPRSSGSLSS